MAQASMTADPIEKCHHILYLGEHHLPSEFAHLLGCNDVPMRAVDLAQLGPIIAECAPVLVVSPLYWNDTDALDVAHRLCAAPYRGRYRALSSHAPPRPELIRREVRKVCPGLDFEVLWPS
ncbi:MAG: hypothetical protein ABNH26_14770 [Celeribacter sp.]|jgi:hypothetical protein